MKRCPQCNRTYTDDALSFCLDDGSPLTVASGPPPDPSATLQYPQARDTTPQPTIAYNPGQAAPPPPPPACSPMPPPQTQKRSVWPWLLAIGAVMLLIGIGVVVLIVMVVRVTIDNNGNGLVVHGEKKDNKLEDYGFLIYNGPGPKYKIILHKAGVETNIVSWTSSNVIRTGTSPNQIEVRISGLKLDLYINGQFITSITDSAGYHRGRVGFYTSDAGEVAFDDLEISK